MRQLEDHKKGSCSVGGFRQNELISHDCDDSFAFYTCKPVQSLFMVGFEESEGDEDAWDQPGGLLAANDHADTLVRVR